MSEIQKYSTLKIPWAQVAGYIGAMVSAILGRTISCSADCEDGSYWSVAANGDTFTNIEVVRLVKDVHGDTHMLQNALPIDSNTSKALDMDLCRALLQKSLDLNWETEFLSEEALWVTGYFPDNAVLLDARQSKVYIDCKVIDLNALCLCRSSLRNCSKKAAPLQILPICVNAMRWRMARRCTGCILSQMVSTMAAALS